MTDRPEETPHTIMRLGPGSTITVREGGYVEVFSDGFIKLRNASFQAGSGNVPASMVPRDSVDPNILDALDLSEPNGGWDANLDPSLNTYIRTDLAALLPTEAGAEPVCTGVKDKDGNTLFLGDLVKYRNEGTHTKKEYWNPEYEIIWKAPSFTLKHVGGGKDGGSHDFILRCGGKNGYLELVRRGHQAATPPAAPTDNTALVDAMECLLALVATPIARRKLGIEADDERIRIVRAALSREAPQAATVEECLEAINQVKAEAQADLHGAKNDFNRGAVDAIDRAYARVRALGGRT